MQDPRTTRIIGRRPPLARWFTLVVGGWLFASVWIWSLPDAVRANTAIVGVAMTAVALYATFMPAVRWLNTLLAVWLFVSTLTVFDDVPVVAMWNNLIAAAAVFAASLLRDDRPIRDETDRRYVQRWARHRAR